MAELDNIIISLCEREEKSGCYDCEIAGFKAYNLIRFKVRNAYLQSLGYNFVEKYAGVNYLVVAKSFIVSSFQIIKILLGRKKYTTMFYPFLRLDSINGVFLDKFTDPIIENCNIKDYIIFERGRRGYHQKPRQHHCKVIYTNLIDTTADIYAKILYNLFVKKYKEEIERLFHSIDIVMDGVEYNKSYMINRIMYEMFYIKAFEKFLKRMEIKKIFAPSRSNIACLTYAARKNNIIVSEFQHGITYGETALYSGRRERDFVPDYFLAFGDTPPRNVYGIDESRIYNIGWAFQDYIDKIQSDVKISDKDVLVISGPCMTDKILSATFRLAKENPDVHFVVRPHPAEVVTEEHRKRVEEYSNVDFQDPKINVAVAMRPYHNIIGENSTVLYEALTYGKKVARLCFEGFAPRYLTPEDEECFWKVNDMASFKAFIDGKPEDKKSMKIYSKFDKELFMKIYNS